MKQWEYFKYNKTTEQWHSLRAVITDKELQVVNSNKRMTYDSESDVYSYHLGESLFALREYKGDAHGPKIRTIPVSDHCSCE